jgi:hypothetical protein
VRKQNVTAEARTSHSVIGNFIERWASSAAAGRANYQIFHSGLCDVLEAARPEPSRSDEDGNAYVFEKAVSFHHGDCVSGGERIYLHERVCFDRVEELSETLVLLGRARQVEEGKYAA